MSARSLNVTSAQYSPGRMSPLAMRDFRSGHCDSSMASGTSVAESACCFDPLPKIHVFGHAVVRHVELGNQLVDDLLDPLHGRRSDLLRRRWSVLRRRECRESRENASQRSFGSSVYTDTES